MVVDQPHERLAQVFGNLAVELQDQKSADTLQSIAEAAARMVLGARWAGISFDPEKKSCLPPRYPLAAWWPSWFVRLSDGAGPQLVRSRSDRLVQSIGDTFQILIEQVGVKRPRSLGGSTH